MTAEGKGAALAGVPPPPMHPQAPAAEGGTEVGPAARGNWRSPLSAARRVQRGAQHPPWYPSWRGSARRQSPRGRRRR
eukprot:249121-Chlamydomonas_euryale.AAC.9